MADRRPRHTLIRAECLRLFESRPSYRLLGEQLDRSSLHCGLAAYFDKLDVCEALGHELAIACLRGENGFPDLAEPLRDALPFRALIGDPFDLNQRAIIPAVTTLTIRLRRYPMEPSFLLHWRDPAKVATAAGVYDVIPAGEFQPANVALWHRRNDFDLWRNVVREYSEELFGTPNTTAPEAGRSTTMPGRCTASWRTPRQLASWSRSFSVSAWTR